MSDLQIKWTFATFGIVGAIAFAALLWSMIRDAWRDWRHIPARRSIWNRDFK